VSNRCFSDFLVTTLPLNTQQMAALEQFFKVKIHFIQTNPQDTIIDSSEWNMQKLFFKNKDEQYITLCEKFSHAECSIVVELR